MVRLVGAEIRRTTPVAGGDINQTRAVTLVDGRTLFVKFNSTAPTGLFEAEANGLRWLNEAFTPATQTAPAVSAWLELPEVVAYANHPAVLILKYLLEGRPRADYAERLGRGLAQLHQTRAPTFGGLPNNYVGTLPQDNTPEPTFVAFFWRRRIEPQLRLALSNRALPAECTRRFATLERRLPELLLEPPYPERVHGDLWSGNVMCGPDGTPVLVDPAAYAGHGEVDLAMMRLFGGFDPRVEAAYHELRPALPGLSDRLRVLQLYPLLVHVNLFGGGYSRQVLLTLETFT